MKQAYSDWIKKHYPTDKEAYGQCQPAAKAMKEAFPELAVTNGFIEDGMWGERAHWWCKDENGEIVDPTRIQFPALFDYTEIDDEHPARKYPQDRCHDCGEYYYRTPELKGKMHNAECHERYVAYLNDFRS